MRTIVIAAGGTGGHLYPGIALAQELSARGARPVFAVRENDLCRPIVTAEGFTCEGIPARGMPRRLSPAVFSFLGAQSRGFLAARALMRRLRPAAVVGMGGYISFPVITAARLAGVPTIIHEQNVLPGLANRVLARIVDRVAVSYPESTRYFPRRTTIVTGNPVRRSLFGIDRAAALERLRLSGGKFTVLVFGGSQGAAAINSAVVNAWDVIPDDARGCLQFIHAAGAADQERVAGLYREKHIPGSVMPYLMDIGDAYAAADLVISRAGATTVAELGMCGTPAILIPYPFATADHQTHNARVLAASGQASVIEEKDLSARALAGCIAAALKAWTGVQPAPRLPNRFPQELLADTVAAMAE